MSTTEPTTPEPAEDPNQVPGTPDEPAQPGRQQPDNEPEPWPVEGEDEDDDDTAS